MRLVDEVLIEPGQRDVRLGVLIAEGLVIVGSADDSVSGLWRYEAGSLKMVWRKAAGRVRPLLIDAGVVVVREWDGEMAGFATDDGSMIWREVDGALLLGEGMALRRSGRLLDIGTGADAGELGAEAQRTVVDPTGKSLLLAHHGEFGVAWVGLKLCGVSMPSVRRVWTRDVLAEAQERYGVVGSPGLTGVVPASSPALRVLSYGGALFGLSSATGEIRWHYPGTVGHGVPEVHQGRLYGMSGSSFLCLDEETGSEIYRVPVSRPASFYLGAHFFGDFMLAGFESGQIFCFDVRDGRVVWTTRVKGGCWGFKSMGDSLYVTTHDARILRFSGDPAEPPDRGTKRRKWGKPVDSYFWTSYSPRAQLELDAVKRTKTEQEKDFARKNALLARELVLKHCGREIGDGLDGLKTLDECLTMDLKAEERGRPLRVEPAPATVFLFGCLAGEILIGLFGGTWVVIGDGDVAIDIALPDGSVVQANVLGKVLKRFRNGLEDSVHQLAEGIAEQIVAAKPSRP